ncbi:MAG: M23 family metallopeptidase [Chitinispirillia bacterium]|jgi:murein DD-endopeptidase MepM/ murein hydrolase activator NlpD
MIFPDKLIILPTIFSFFLELIISFQSLSDSKTWIISNPINFTISGVYAAEKYNIEDFEYIFDSEIEDTINAIQPIPKKYSWLFPTDKESDITWKKFSKHFILPIDFSLCYLPDKGRFRCNRVATEIPHTGMDLYANDNADVLAAMAGKVIYVGDIGAKGLGKAFGWTIIIEHMDSEGISNDYYSIYAHITKKSICVNPGDEVAQGQIIAKVGNTGNARGYPTQVHFEIRKTKDPILAKIRIGSRSSYKKVQLFNPEIIYKREQLYTHIRNVDTKSVLNVFESNLPVEFVNDENLMDYISLVRQRLSNTLYPVEPLKYVLAANVDLNYNVSDSLANEYISYIMSIQTNSFKHYSIAVNNSGDSIKTGAEYYKEIHKAIKKSNYRKNLNIAFRLTSNEGVKLYYKKSDNQINTLSYQNGIIVNSSEYSCALSDLLKYQKLAVLEFGFSGNFLDLNDQKYTRLVIQSQNLIEYWARDREDIAIFAYNDRITEYDYSPEMDKYENRPEFVFPDYLIAKLFLQKPSIRLGSIQLKDIIADNEDILQQLYNRFMEESLKLIDDYDAKLKKNTSTFDYLDSMTVLLDSFVNLGRIEPQKAKKRYDVLNKYGLSISYKANDQIWDALHADKFDTAMNLFIKNSKYFLRYSEEQYYQVFNRIENYKKVKQEEIKTVSTDARPILDKQDSYDNSSDEDKSNEESAYEFINTQDNVNRPKDSGNISRGKTDTGDNVPSQ